MSSLRALSNSELLDSTSRLAADERRITLAVIEHFREVERRKAYSDLGYASLSEYAVSHLHYSEASASRRIAAMWALKDCPELASRIERGEVNVTTVARIQTTIRRDEKLTDSKWDATEKREAYREMGSLSVDALERRLIEISPLAAVREKVKLVTPELYEVTLHLTSEGIAHLETLRAAHSHGLKNANSNSELFQKLIQMGIAELERKRTGPSKEPSQKGRSKAAERKAAAMKNPESSPLVMKDERFSPLAVKDEETLSGAAEVENERTTFNSPSISARDKRILFRRADYRCQYVDKEGNRCKCRFFLQIEHRIPRAHGGTNELSNLEILCRNHNLIRGIERFGMEKMKRTG